MRAKEIKNLAEDLRENYNTRNPFELADKFGIKVLISKVLPADKKAYTIKSDKYPTIIIVNGRYEYKSQSALVCIPVSASNSVLAVPPAKPGTTM